MEKSEREAIVQMIIDRAPTQEARDKVIDMVAELRKYEPAKSDNILRTLAGCLYDGLTYGNWPWSNFKVSP